MRKTSSTRQSFSAKELFSGGGDMGALMRSKDWSQTPLGAPENWPHSLKVTVRIILMSRYPMFVWWGKDLINLYNDRYVPMLGKKHPASLGTSGRKAWKEIWDQISPRVEAVMQRGEATFDEALLLMTDRHGYREEAYFTFSYSPLPDDAGKIGGLFCAVTEDTERVISERRIALLRKLATSTANARTTEAVCAGAGECLAEADRDLPFSLIYLRDGDGRTLNLACTAGIDGSHPAGLAALSVESADPWPVSEVLSRGTALLVSDLRSKFTALPTGAWSEPPEQALVVPLAQQGQTEATGVLIAGLNPHRKVDENFEGFVGLVAGQIAAGLANANAYNAERKRAEALAEIDRAKTTFFSNVSHEFRTPLTLMLGPTEDALSSASRALSGAELERVHRHELRLLKLVNTLLDFSRLETGRIKAKFQATDLSAFTAELASLFRSAIQRAQLEFVLTAPALPEPVYVDRDMWEKIVLNLLSNALKSTFEGGIRVEVRHAGDHAELIVADSGTGIPENEIPHLFERFRRVENARRRTHEGSGIGLALVHELVRMHGGAVSVRSVVNRGTTFTISLPYGRVHIPAGAIVALDSSPGADVSRNAYIQEALSWLPGADPSAQETAWLRDAGAVPNPNLDTSIERAGGHVLLVDDNRDMREYVAKLLSERFTVTTAENGRVALEYAKRYLPDVVLSDVMMPEMDGFALISALRNDPATSTLPVILLSARAGEEAQIEGMEAGADDYLIKPFSARELLARVEAHIRIARFRKQAIAQQLQLTDELQQARQLANEAAENISDSLFALSHEWRFTYMNPRARDLIRAAGVPTNPMGKSVWELFPGLEDTEFGRQYTICMEQRVPVQFEAPFGQSWYSVRAYPSPGGIVIYAIDVTASKDAERALRVKQEHLVLTQRVAKIGSWELDVEEEFLTISPEVADIAGWNPNISRVRYAQFLNSLFLSSDRQRAEDALELALRKKKEFNIELRLRRSDGQVRLVSNRGKVFYNQGQPVVLGVLVDITPAHPISPSAKRIKKPGSTQRKTAKTVRKR